MTSPESQSYDGDGGGYVSVRMRGVLKVAGADVVAAAAIAVAGEEDGSGVVAEARETQMAVGYGVGG